jgi:eukaryotic-like serine/threonine-protein kinase
MATGDCRFTAKARRVIFEAILNRTPVAPVRLNPDVPPKLEDIINKALEKDRNLRYQHAAEMRADLQRLKRDSESGHSLIHRRAPESGRWPQIAPRQQWPNPSATTKKPARHTRQIRRLMVVVARGNGGVLLSLAPAAHHLTEKDTIVLADFANSTGDPIFDDTLKTALNVSLRQSPFLNVLSDSEVAEDLANDDASASTKLTPSLRASFASGQAAKLTLPDRSAVWAANMCWA